jgi:hypothetical protein
MKAQPVLKRGRKTVPCFYPTSVISRRSWLKRLWRISLSGRRLARCRFSPQGEPTVADVRTGDSAPSGEKQPHPTDPNRWADGTVRSANQLRVTHGAYRREREADAMALCATKVDALLADRGGESPSVVWLDLARRYAEAAMLADTFISHIGQTPLTNSGRTKRALAGYFAAADRQLKLAQLLGLERKARPVGALTPAELMRQRQAASLERS